MPPHADDAKDLVIAQPLGMRRYGRSVAGSGVAAGCSGCGALPRRCGPDLLDLDQGRKELADVVGPLGAAGDVFLQTRPLAAPQRAWNDSASCSTGSRRSRCYRSSSEFLDSPGSAASISLSFRRARMYRLLAADSWRPSSRATSALVQVLKVPQDQDFAVEGVHGVECLLQPLLPLGADRGHAGAGVAAQELGRQGGRARLRQRPVQQLHLAPRVARLDPQVPAMDDLERHPCQPAEPEEKRPLGLLQVFRQSLRRLEKGLLKHVRRVDSPSKAVVQAERDHAPQAVTMRCEDRGPCRLVSSDRSLQPCLLVWRIVLWPAGSFHKSINCAHEATRDRNNRDDQADDEIGAEVG